MKAIFLLATALCIPGAAFGRNVGGTPKATVKDNVLHALAQYGLENSVTIIEVTKNNVFAVPEPHDGVDLLAADFQNKKRWRKSWSVYTKIAHHDGVGYRAKRSYSLHVIVHRQTDGSIIYEIHVDHWSPGFWHLRSEFLHFFFEYSEHKLLHHDTNQEKIARGLDKEDRARKRRAARFSGQ